MRKTNFMRSLKRRALPLLTSVAMAISMLSGIGVTAMAARADDQIQFVSVNGKVFTAEFVHKMDSAQSVAAANVTHVIVNGDLNHLLPNYKDVYGSDTPKGEILYWESGSRLYDPSTDTFGNVSITATTLVTPAVLTGKLSKGKNKLSYDLDGGHFVTGDRVPDEKEYDTNASYAVPDPVKDGFDFAGWDLDGDGVVNLDAGKTVDDQNATLDNYSSWDGKVGATILTAVWHVNKATLIDDAEDVEALVNTTTKSKIDAAVSALNAAKKATEDANEAAKKASENPTADTAAAARKAADAAKTAADTLSKASAAAETAYKEAVEEYKAVHEEAQKAGLLNDTDVKKAFKDIEDAFEAALGSYKDKTIEEVKKEMDEAVAAANKAAENALAAAAEADKNDGSEPGKLAPVESKLKDANGEYTGYVVTNADPSNPEVEYVATDADKKAKKISLPEKVKDRSGNEYNVTSIAAKALERADVKEIIIPKSVKKIGDKAFYKSKAKKITIKTTKKGKIKIGDKAFRVKPDKAKIRVKGAKGKYKDKIVKHVKKNAKKTADVK
ncbi:leucine-rich repeat protein [Butyrivibrio sp. FC2001]|uniref:leucine-rich repeat protein n=1 Tax=Butyrivibrio sp. FC2001 TaxID=1280671 RepID=UPI0003F9BC32|nr:leucine-rich repeat protein [Butyrivibrio sp. FC2001]